MRVTVECGNQLGALPRIWAAFGYDELNWTATPRGRRNLARLRAVLEVPWLVRAHNLLTSGTGRGLPHWSSGNVYHEDADGNPFYDWSVVDPVFDAWIGNGMRPIVELGFCPFRLTRTLPGPEFVPMPSSYGEYEARLWASPPVDFGRWAGLVRAVAEHCRDRYGTDKVRDWYWELWNEPDIAYWQGTVEEYCELYDVTAEAIAESIPGALVGGPATTGGGTAFLLRFLEHCSRRGSRLDFVSFHTKGAPVFPRRYGPLGPDGVRDGEPASPSTTWMLAEITENLDIIRSFPRFAETPVLVDECDPGVPAHLGVYDNRNYGFRNTAYYPVFQLQLMRRLLDLDRPGRRGVAAAAAWAWYLEGDRYFEGTRSLFTASDVAVPVLTAYAMLGRLGERRVSVESDRSDVDGLASVSGQGRVAVIVWHHRDDQYATGTVDVDLSVRGLACAGKPVVVHHFRVDATHSNSHTAWVREGRPQDPTDEQRRRIRAAEGLQRLAAPQHHASCPRELALSFPMSLPAASLIEIVPEAAT